MSLQNVDIQKDKSPPHAVQSYSEFSKWSEGKRLTPVGVLFQFEQLSLKQLS